MHFSSCWAMFSPTSWALVNVDFMTSTMLRASGLADHLLNGQAVLLDRSPPLPLNNAGSERSAVNTEPLALSRSISIFEDTGGIRGLLQVVPGSSFILHQRV